MFTSRVGGQRTLRQSVENEVELHPLGRDESSPRDSEISTFESRTPTSEEFRRGSGTASHSVCAQMRSTAAHSVPHTNGGIVTHVQTSTTTRQDASTSPSTRMATGHALQPTTQQAAHTYSPEPVRRQPWSDARVIYGVLTGRQTKRDSGNGKAESATE